MINYILNLFLVSKPICKNSMVIKGKSREIEQLELKVKEKNNKTPITDEVIEVFENREKFYKKLFKERFCI